MAVSSDQSAEALMMSESEEQSLSHDDQLLDCAICMDKIVDPCLLPCSHTFCQRCIVRHYQFSRRCTADQVAEESEVISCPACRQTWPLPAGIDVTQQLTSSAHPEYQFSRSGLNESICCPSSYATANVNHQSRISLC